MGGHEKRKSIPCHLTNISCGLPCGRQLPCGQHKCQRSCHKGECLMDGQTCKQPCVTPRECGHPCNEPCHAGHACPKSSCKSEVALTCVCGFRTEKVMCWQQSGKDGYQKLATSMLALQMKDSQSGDTIDISSLTQETTRTKHLECNQACAQHERNQRVALALEIKNPDLSSKLGHPPYPQFIKDFAKQHPDFVNAVEKALSVLVNTAQQSKQPKRSHSFAPMSFEQRRVVHTLAEFYGCETLSYDHEPKKNIVATAYKNKCWHPTVTVSALVGNSSMAPIPFRHTSLLKLRSVSASTGNSGSPNVPEPTASESGSASWASALKANTSTHKPQQETTTDYFEMTD
ncbi:Transcriptional repressor NF-X1 [Lamellibrachia satsuma]|nr:Transcriptional repressor NF-X1 [Lamellibrachia satsuma]